MGPKKDVNNPEALDNEEGQEEIVDEELPNEDEEQGEGTDTEEESEEQDSEESSEDEEEGGSEESGKGIPDDPKLLRKKLTQVTTEFNEYKRAVDAKFAELEGRTAKPGKEPTRLQLIDSGQLAPEELTSEDLKKMSPQQYTKYLVERGKMELRAELDQTYAPTLKSAQIQSARAMVKDFLAENPEAKEHIEEIKTTIKSYADKGMALELDDVWDIVKGRHPEVAEKKVQDKIKLKKKANMIKDSGTPPSKKMVIKDKPSRAEAVNAAFDQLGID